MTTDNFANWLQDELNRRDWTQAELARKSRAKTATISRIMTGARNVGPDTARSIARAMNIPPIIVFQKAGLLPPIPDASENTELAMQLFMQLAPRYQETAIEYLRLQLEDQKKLTQAIEALYAAASDEKPDIKKISDAILGYGYRVGSDKPE